jgi:glycosyltransferase involved in cell wall biosynthesis
MSRRFKICHVISGYHRTDARIFYRQCLSLRDHGFDVCILTNDGQPNEVIDGIPIISCTSAPAGRKKELLMARRLFYSHAIAIDADAYQLHSPELLPLGVKLKRHGKVVVYDAHEDMPNHILEKEWLPPWSRHLVSRAFALYMNRVLKRFDEVVSPHSHVVHSLQKRLGKGILIANFPLVKKRPDSSVDEYLRRKNLFCYSGTVYSYSNQSAIAAALSEIADAHYEIAGHIDDDQREMLSNSAAGSRISCLGRLSQVELAKFYDRSIAGIVVYDYKLNLGYRLGSYGTNKIFEYMEAGLPIICTDYDLWTDIVDRYKCGICVKPGDVPGLRQAMQSIMADKKAAFQMGINGRHAVEKEFNWTSEEAKYCRMFSDLLKA